MNQIEKRLAAIEAQRKPGKTYVLCRRENGEEIECMTEEWYAHRDELTFIRFTRGFDRTYSDMELLNRAIDEECKCETY